MQTKNIRGDCEVGKNAKIPKDGRGGEGSFPEMQVLILLSLLVFICHLSQGFIVISSAKLLWHIWRLPLNAAANNAGSARFYEFIPFHKQLFILKQGNIYERKSTYYTYTPTYPSIPLPIHPSCGATLFHYIARVLLSREQGRAPAKCGHGWRTSQCAQRQKGWRKRGCRRQPRWRLTCFLTSNRVWCLCTGFMCVRSITQSEAELSFTSH